MIDFFCRSTLIVLALATLAGCRAPGQRYITVAVERDGATVLESGYGVSDSLGEEAWFESLQNAAFSESTKLEVDEKDPTQVTLQGDLRIVLSHTTNLLVVAKSAELSLVADPSMPGHWKLAPGEASRLRQLSKNGAN